MDKKAVSPVIAVMLLVAVATSAVASYFVWFQNIEEKIIELPTNIRIDIPSGDLVATISSEEELKELEIRKSHLIGGEYTTKYGRIHYYTPVSYVTITDKNGFNFAISTKQGGVISKIPKAGLYKIVEYDSMDGTTYKYLKWASWDERYEGLAEVIIEKVKELRHQSREFNSIEEIKKCEDCRGFSFRYNEEKKSWIGILEQEEEEMHYREIAIKDNKIFILKDKNTTYIEKAR